MAGCSVPCSTPLPFEPTGAQRRAVAEIQRDMASGDRMLRLLQGDVGSGKTLVALLAMLTAIETGAQAALMAPTEILARQHFATLQTMAAPAGCKVALLTGRDKGRTRQAILDGLADGSIALVIGTHALFQEDVTFRDLALAVIDEQHRFGVEQRVEIANKGSGVDVLVMTATPIPRSLMLTSYGDLDATRLDEKPPGRQPISHQPGIARPQGRGHRRGRPRAGGRPEDLLDLPPDRRVGDDRPRGGRGASRRARRIVRAARRAGPWPDEAGRSRPRHGAIRA